MFTLKIASRSLDESGRPAQQIWHPGVMRISRIAERPASQVYAAHGGCWRHYDGPDFINYVGGIAPMSMRADELRTNQRIKHDGETWIIRTMTVAMIAGSDEPSTATVELHLVSPNEQLGINPKFPVNQLIPVVNESEEYIREFDPPLTLLWVGYDDGRGQYIVCEQAWLLGPTGATVDKVAGL